MASKFERDGLNLTKDVLGYVRSHSVAESPAQVAIREATMPLPNGAMMIAPEQGNLMAFLLGMIRPKRVIEVGVFTGYSATWLASALADDGQIIACEMSPDYLATATAAWAKAGLLSQIVPRVGPATTTLKSLLADGWAGTVDAMFIDADKTGYDTYYTLGLELLRPGGIMLFDNMLWSGKVVDPTNTEDSTAALRALAARIGQDGEVHKAFLTDGDGIMAVMKPF